MWKYIVGGIVIIIIIVVVLFSGGTSMSSSKHLKEKYPNIKFTYVDQVDSGSGWKKEHYVSENGEDIVVNCGKGSCLDNYYNIYNKKKADEYVYNALSKIYALSDYKYYNNNVAQYFNNNVTLDTPIENVVNIDKSFSATGPVDVYVSNMVNLTKNDFTEFTTHNIHVTVYLIPQSDYIKLNTDYRRNITDFKSNSNYNSIYTNRRIIISI